MDHKQNITHDLEAIEKLSDLKKQGIISEAEFVEKKNLILKSNSDKSQNKNEADDEKKLINKIKNAGSSSEAIGWLEIIIISAIFGYQILSNVSIFGYFGNSILITSSVIAIILGRRIKAADDKNTKRYLKILLINFIIAIGLVIASGGRIGALGILLIIYLIQAIRAINKLEKLGVYSERFKHKTYKINKSGWVVYSILCVLFILFSFVIEVQSYNDQNTGIANSSWKSFNSIDEGFKIDFPTYPQKDEQQPTQIEGITMQMTTFQSNVGDNNTYLVAVYDYDIEPDSYNVEDGLEGMINGFVNGVDGASVESSTPTTFNNYQALDFIVNVPSDNITFKGRAIIRDDLPTIKAYLVTSGSISGESTNHTQFLDSFNFTD